MSSATIRRVSYAEILGAPNAQELLDAYAAECSLPEIGETCPDVEMYDTLGRSGIMHSFGVFDGSLLVGFASVLITSLPHYSRRVATMESIFILKEHRSGTLGRALMLAVEQLADSMNCEAILYSAPHGSRFQRFLALNSDYRHSNDVYVRRLK